MDSGLPRTSSGARRMFAVLAATSLAAALVSALGLFVARATFLLFTFDALVAPTAAGTAAFVGTLHIVHGSFATLGLSGACCAAGQTEAEGAE